MAGKRTIAELHARLTADVRQYETEMRKAGIVAGRTQQTVGAAFTKMRGQVVGAMKGMAGILGVTAFASMANNAVNLGSKVSDLAEQLRIGTDELQTLFAISAKAGVAQQDLERAIRNVNIRTQQAIDGNKSYAFAIERMGINLQKFNALESDKKIEVIALAYDKAGKSQQAYADVARILGEKAGPKMLEVLRRLSTEGFPKLIAQSKEAGLVMSRETIHSLDQAADAIAKFKDRITIAMGNIIVDFQSETGLQKLQFQFMEVAARFGGRILDAIIEAGGMGKAVFTAAFGFVADALGDDLNTILNRIAVKFLEIQEKIQRLNPFASREDYLAILDMLDAARRAAGGGEIVPFTVRLEAEIAKTSKSNFADEWGKFWADQVDALAEIQREEIAATIPITPVIPKAAIEDAKKVLSAFDKEMALMWNNVSDRAGQAFADMVLTGEASFGDLVDIVARSMLEIAARMAIINPLLNMVFGGFSGFTALPTFSDGGRPPTGRASLVGEEGPELFVPDAAGTIIPNHKLASAGGGGDTFSVSYNIASGVSRQELVPVLEAHGRRVIGEMQDLQRRRSLV